MERREFTTRSTRAALACGLGLTFGVAPVVNSSFGLFMPELQHAFGWSRGAISATHAFQSWTMALLVPFAGRAMDRFGVRALAVPSALLLGVAMLGLSLLNGSLSLLYALFVMVGVAEATGGSVAFSKVVAGWFDRHRGVVLSTVAIGLSLGSILFPTLVGHWITHGGWRYAYVGVGILVLAVSLPSALFLLRERGRGAAASDALPDPARPAEDESSMTAAEARRSRAFILIFVAGCLTSLVKSGVWAHLPAFATDHGIPVSAAASIVSIAAVGGILSNLGAGFLLDRVTTPRIAAAFVGCTGCGILLLDFGSGYATYCIAAVLIGIGINGEYAMLPYFLSRFFGLRHMAEMFGLLSFGLGVSSGLGPLALGLLFDAAGSYETGLKVYEGLVILIMLCFIAMPGYRYRLRSLAQVAPVAVMRGSPMQDEPLA